MTLSDQPDARFTDQDWLKHIDTLNLPHLTEWMRSQASRGQDYYLRRLDRLAFRGGRVLDAGCGVGNWAVALAQRFEEVDAIDSEAERVAVLEGMAPRLAAPVRPRVGSVTDLPYDDSSFDAVFCNGVVFLTDTDVALAEFARVLRPGGMLYVSYNGPDWWRHLIRDRGPAEPVCYMYGSNGLITWAFRLAAELDLSTVATMREKQSIEAAGGGAAALVPALQAMLERLSLQPNRRARDLLDCLRNLAHEGVDRSYLERAARDIASRSLRGQPDHDVLAHTYTHRPEDMTDALSRLGFVDILAGREGCVCLDVDALPVKPIYTFEKGVFETVARKS